MMNRVVQDSDQYERDDELTMKCNMNSLAMENKGKGRPGAKHFGILLFYL